VYGAGRVGAALATVLSAAGVGAVDLIDSGRVEPWDTSPAGIPAEHVGDRRDAAGRGAVRRAGVGGSRGPGRGLGGPSGPSGTGPGTGPGAAHRSRQHPGRGPDPGSTVIVLAPRDGLRAYAPEVGEARQLVAAGVPHLYTGVLEGTGVVGPLVLPGRTACGECLGLRLADEDPAWPRMLAQLRSGRQSAVPACDVALATTVAGLAAAHVLAHLDGRVPPSAGARVELSLGRLSTRVRALAGDARCGCGAGLTSGDAREGIGDTTGDPPRGATEGLDGYAAWLPEVDDGGDGGEQDGASRAATGDLSAGSWTGRGTMAM
jgi:bacteriocin biosynthesis cyclodehydratase domain-containing protein